MVEAVIRNPKILKANCVFKKITLVAFWRMDNRKTRVEAIRVTGLRFMLVELYTSKWTFS